ncbi:hypothetical protein VTL71DRAFT_8821 [Oculimacula yallundae]|uniref:Disintegrin and metalloproteinase domain-containing protein B n=1 Tax=Oculimacula yallundae TaxID=86028 RepID=A0ABR4CYV1_9HELO
MKFLGSFKVAALASFVVFVGCEARSEARDRINHVYAVENPIINTETRKVTHDSSFDLTFALENSLPRVKLVLEPNRNILSSTAYVNYLDGDGNIRHAEPLERAAHKVFKGKAWLESESGEWEESGWARVYMKRDGDAPLVEGAFSISGEQHHIQLRSSYVRMKRDGDFHISQEEGQEERMIVYRDSDMKKDEKRDGKEEGRCQSDNLAFNTGPDNPLAERDGILGVSWNSASLGSLANRQIIPGGTSGYGDLRGSIGSTEGCPTSSRVALIGIATDCSYTASFANAEAVRTNIIAMVNTASDVYERTFNIALGLQNLTVSDAQCPAQAADSTPWNVACTTSDDIEAKLSQFSAWRASRGDSNAYWTLMSGCRSGSVVGIAWLGQLCVSTLRGSGQQSVTGANVVVRTPSEWQVFAHESAHTFGAVHDCDSSICAAGGSSQCCPFSSSGCDASGQFLMNPTSSRDMSEFSQCTVGNICSMMRSNAVRSRCLVNNVNVPTINGAQCGNGIVETGEQCDCGTAEECGANSCCDPSTCQFRANAVCDDTNDACCNSCQFAAANTVCRASRGPCDLQEVCSGSTGSCPTDAFQPNGGSCGNATDQFCAEGQCTSRNLQCQQVVIQGAVGNYSNSCDDDLCRLRCSQSANSQFCTQLNRNLLDGTPCNGGTCSSGRCSSGNSNGGGNGSGDAVGSWFSRNRSLVIGLAAGLGSYYNLLTKPGSRFLDQRFMNLPRNGIGLDHQRSLRDNISTFSMSEPNISLEDYKLYEEPNPLDVKKPRRPIHYPPYNIDNLVYRHLPRRLPSLCHFCETVFEHSYLFDEDEEHLFEHHYYLASFRRSVEQGCEVCILLELGFGSHSPRYTTDHHGNIDSQRGMMYLRRGNPRELQLLVPQKVGQDPGFVAETRVYLSECEEQQIATCLDSEYVPSTLDALPLCKKWLRFCTEHHTECKSKTRQKKPTRLIAISGNHCWGGKGFVRLLKSNFVQFQDKISQEILPKTFQDAIFIASDDWVKESATMQDVYHGSDLTIAAVSAEDGSVGCFFQRDRALRCPVSLVIDGMEKAFDVTADYTSFGIDCPLLRRGWVLQEQYLSHRTLYFHDHQVFWDCRENSTSESGYPFYDDKIFSPFHTTATRANWPGIVGDYSRMDLTRITDRLVAIGGLAGFIQAHTGDEYFAGLWKTEFECQLLWRTLHAIDRTTLSMDYVAPSWSWASIGREQWLWQYDVKTQDTLEFIVQLHDVTVETASSSHFGQVISGTIRLNCEHLRHGSIQFNKKDPDNSTLVLDKETRKIHASRDRWHFLPRFEEEDDAVGFYRPGEGPQLSTTEEGSLEPAGNLSIAESSNYVHDIWLLPIVRSRGWHNGQYGLHHDGLLLESTKVKQGQYRRIGMYIFCYTDDDFLNEIKPKASDCAEVVVDDMGTERYRIDVI